MKRLNCYIYTRVSTSMQVEGFSLDAQREKLRKYAEYQEMHIAGEYSDEGKSGKNIGGRLEFQKMLSDIASGKDSIDYVLVFKLSRFGRNAADVLSSLQIMQDYGANLICVEDGIDSSKDSGKLMISVLSAVAEIERENILVQTMEGRKQKAREGKWNGGFAPYGYYLEKGELKIAEDEAETIRLIFDKYINTNMGANGIAKYLNQHGIAKKPRQNGTLNTFSAHFIKLVIQNPVYCGKIAFGRRKTEKINGTRNEYHIVKQEQYPVYDGIHEAIVSVEDWELAQQKRKKLGVKREKIYNLDHEHLLSGLLRCPVCGAAMYGNINRKKKPDGTIYKDHFYYACKHRMRVDGHKCDYHRQWNQTVVNGAVEEVIERLVSNPEFEKALCEKINTRVSTEGLEEELAVFKKQLNQLVMSKRKLASQMDTLDVTDRHYDKKYQDMQNRLYDFYDEIEVVEEQITELQARIANIKEEKISGENVYLFLHYYGTMYKEFTDAEKKRFLNTFIESIEIFKEEQPDGRLLKCINFKFPVFYDGDENVTHIRWDSETTVESVVCMSRKKADDCREEPKMISDERSKYKSWGNLKKQMNDLLCDSLKGKISYFYTSYHEVHNAYGRATIQYESKEMVAFSWDKQYEQVQDIKEQYRKMDNVPSALVDFEGCIKAYRVANTTVTKEKWMPNCTLCETDFINSITIYLKTDIATSLNSDNYLLRVFAYMDRRVGKRTLIKIKDDVEKLPDWVKQFYQIRCEADGIVFPPKRMTDETVVQMVKK